MLNAFIWLHFANTHSAGAGVDTTNVVTVGISVQWNPLQMVIAVVDTEYPHAVHTTCTVLVMYDLEPDNDIPPPDQLSVHPGHGVAVHVATVSPSEPLPPSRAAAFRLQYPVTVVVLGGSVVVVVLGPVVVVVGVLVVVLVWHVIVKVTDDGGLTLL